MEPFGKKNQSPPDLCSGSAEGVRPFRLPIASASARGEGRGDGEAEGARGRRFKSSTTSNERHLLKFHVEIEAGTRVACRSKHGTSRCRIREWRRPKTV